MKRSRKVAYFFLIMFSCYDGLLIFKSLNAFYLIYISPTVTLVIWPVDIAKVLSTPILKNIWERLLL